ncbi:outer membrane protein [Kordia periserrulae]|uniref:Outer membrane protein n=1 Tax=Kordia periserrulae TaxID=701523 RepID=A0A2T6C495_9FLAO|nr:TolC family protein [Kordia periserrulae]PTX63159.1 outer membrane protein [Kordia periserrulae]
MKKYIIHIFLISFITGYGQEASQQRITLSECIEIAIKNNLDVQKSEFNNASETINHRQAKWDMFPTMNLDFTHGVNNGRSIDPFTNDVINQELTFSNARLDLNVTVFNNFRLLNTLAQMRLNKEASEMEIVEARQNLVLQVTLLFLQILNGQEILELAKRELESTEKQLQRLNKLKEQEAGDPLDYNDIMWQMKLNKISLVEAKNALNINISKLIELMNVDDEVNFLFEDIIDATTFEKYQLTPSEVYNQAVENQGSVQARQLRLDAAEKGIKVARANYFPEISVFGQLNTNYSSLARIFRETGVSVEDTGAFVTVDGSDLPVFSNVPQLVPERLTFSNQFENNLNVVVGLSVRIPIFNGFTAKNNVQLEKIKKEERSAELTNIKNRLKQAINQAFNNMKAAYERYNLLKEQIEYAEESFRINEVKFNAGVSNLVDYILSKNKREQNLINLSTAKYEYLLNVKILEYYRGL